MKEITGKCHCGNISYVLLWPGNGEKIPVRACGCTFCTKHGGSYTSNREAELRAVVGDKALVSSYQFGTATATFHVCARCGVVPFVTSQIEGHLYAVVNVNTFEGIDPSSFVRAASCVDGENVADRLERRKGTWIPSVSFSK